MTMFKKNGGFTLVELIVVIAILAILAGVAIPAYSGYIAKAQEAADTTTLSAIKTAAIAAKATDGAVTAIKVVTDGAGVVTEIWVNVDNEQVATPENDTDDTDLIYKPLYGAFTYTAAVPGADGAEGTPESWTQKAAGTAPEFLNDDFALFANESIANLKNAVYGAEWHAADSIAKDDEGKLEYVEGWTAVTEEADKVATEANPAPTTPSGN